MKTVSNPPVPLGRPLPRPLYDLDLVHDLTLDHDLDFDLDLDIDHNLDLDLPVVFNF